jgi:antitoxin component YwqK of YwqJK toxin-antitoxin module
LCKFENNQILCPEHNIKRPDNLVTNIYKENSDLSISAHKDGVIICELDLKNATDVCHDEKGKLINGIIKIYDKESGNLIQQNTYKNGKSIKSVNYHTNGVIASESTPDGILRAYNTKSQFIYTTEILDNYTVLKEYDQEGNITSTTYYYKDGTIKKDTK